MKLNFLQPPDRYALKNVLQNYFFLAPNCHVCVPSDCMSYRDEFSSFPSLLIISIRKNNFISNFSSLNKTFEIVFGSPKTLNIHRREPKSMLVFIKCFSNWLKMAKVKSKEKHIVMC